MPGSRMRWNRARKFRSINQEHDYLAYRADKFLAKADARVSRSAPTVCTACGCGPADYLIAGRDDVRFCSVSHLVAWRRGGHANNDAEIGL